VRHVVADPVRSVPQGQFGKITGSDDQPVVHVRKTKEMRGALSGLNVFERDVVDRLPMRKRVVKVAKHLLRRGADIDLYRCHGQSPHQVPCGLASLR
jgi:hypothetical protein